MDIAALSMAISQTQAVQAASTAMLSKSLDHAETTGDAMVNMLEKCANPNVGNKIDVSI